MSGGEDGCKTGRHRRTYTYTKYKTYDDDDAASGSCGDAQSRSGRAAVYVAFIKYKVPGSPPAGVFRYPFTPFLLRRPTDAYARRRKGSVVRYTRSIIIARR